VKAAELAFDPVSPGFSRKFMAPADVDALFEETYVDIHRRYVRSRPKMVELLR
jgi:hypothetical protein